MTRQEWRGVALYGAAGGAFMLVLTAVLAWWLPW